MAGRSKFNFRLVNDEVSNELSGYAFNAITPFNMTVTMPLLISDRITNLEYIWFGGGHVDVKLRMDVKEMINKYENRVFIANIAY